MNRKRNPSLGRYRWASSDCHNPIPKGIIKLDYAPKFFGARIAFPFRVNRYTGDPAASPAMSAIPPKAEVNSED